MPQENGISPDGHRMRLIRELGRSWLTGLGIVLVVVVGCLILGRIGLAAFDRLESRQVSEDARRLTTAVDYEIRLLASFGSTNAVWDDLYTDVSESDQEGFTRHVPPDSVFASQGIDVALGVGVDGRVRAGGLTTGGASYQTPPEALVEPAGLLRLVDLTAAAGDSRCGVTSAGGVGYLFCGLGVFRDDGSGPVAGGLILFKALSGRGLQELSQRSGLALRIGEQHRKGQGPWTAATAELTGITTATSLVGPDRIALRIRLLGVDSQAVVLECFRSRPIHQMAVRVGLEALGVGGAVCLVLLVLLVAVLRREVAAQVRPLRRTAQNIVGSGDWSLRIGEVRAQREIAELARTIDVMLDEITRHEETVRSEQRAREQQHRVMAVQQRRGERQLRVRAQSLLDETTMTVAEELREVVGQIDQVRAALMVIGERARSADLTVQETVTQARAADPVMRTLEESLRRVSGITRLIASVAEKTNLLALNAALEAQRAGSAGRGFQVVATEVQELANTTAQSTGEIEDTVRSLQRDTGAITHSFAAVTAGLGQIDTAATAVSEVAAEQAGMVRTLDSCLHTVLGRIQAMEHLTDQLDRRSSARAPISGAAVMHLPDGSTHPVSAVDISEGGMCVRLDDGVVMAPGDRAEFEVMVADGLIRVDAEVVRLVTQGLGGGRGVGIRFDRPSGSVVERIRDYVADSPDAR